MKFKTLMVVKAAACLFVGILLLLQPNQLLNLLGVTVGAGGLLLARAYGAALIGYLMLTWHARDAGDSAARRAIILDLFVYDAIGLVVMLVAVITGVINLLGWGIVGVYLFFTLGYGYYWFAQS